MGIYEDLGLTPRYPRAEANGGIVLTERTDPVTQKHYLDHAISKDNIVEATAAAATDYVMAWIGGEPRKISVANLLAGNPYRMIYTFKWVQTLSGAIDAAKAAGGWSIPLVGIAGRTNRVKRIKIVQAEVTLDSEESTVVAVANKDWNEVTGKTEATVSIAAGETVSTATVCDIELIDAAGFVYVKNGALHGSLTVQIEIEVL